MEIKEDTKKVFESHTGFTQDQISKQYDDLCGNYEEVYNGVGWPDPDNCAQQIVDNGFTEDKEVLDMGCGTGLVGQYLKDKTKYENLKVMGVDASDGMIKKAEEKKVYSEFRNMMLCNPEKFVVDQKDLEGRFDFVSASGLLAEGHATPAVFDEMLFSLKTGGFAIFTSRKEYLEPLKYQEGMDEKVKDGKWELTHQTSYEKYSNSKDNPVGRFKPVMVELFVFKKL
jgi:predicted TPR repeat methyltransferase